MFKPSNLPWMCRKSQWGLATALGSCLKLIVVLVSRKTLLDALVVGHDDIRIRRPLSSVGLLYDVILIIAHLQGQHDLLLSDVLFLILD